MRPAAGQLEGPAVLPPALEAKLLLLATTLLLSAWPPASGDAGADGELAIVSKFLKENSLRVAAGLAPQMMWFLLSM
jgi:hypothetical protein